MDTGDHDPFAPAIELPGAETQAEPSHIVGRQTEVPEIDGRRGKRFHTAKSRRKDVRPGVARYLDSDEKRVSRLRRLRRPGEHDLDVFEAGKVDAVLRRAGVRASVRQPKLFIFQLDLSVSGLDLDPAIADRVVVNPGELVFLDHRGVGGHCRGHETKTECQKKKSLLHLRLPALTAHNLAKTCNSNPCQYPMKHGKICAKEGNLRVFTENMVNGTAVPGKSVNDPDSFAASPSLKLDRRYTQKTLTY